MKKDPDISILVSNYNSSSLINGALESIVSTAGDVAFDGMILDDASTDGGLALVDEKYKNDSRFLFVQNEKNVGYHAINVAITTMRGKYLMTLDTDATLLHGTLRSLIVFMDTHPEAGAATGNLHYPDGRVQNYYRRLMTPLYAFYTSVIGRFIDKYFLGLRYYNAYHYQNIDMTRMFEIEQPVVACLILRREAIGAMVMDPDYEHFGDVDLCRRIYDRGYKIYLVPDAKVLHIKSASFNKKTSAWRERKYYAGLATYFKRYYPIRAPYIIAWMCMDRMMRVLLERTVGRAPMR